MPGHKKKSLLTQAKMIGQHINRNFKYSPKQIGERREEEKRHQAYCWDEIGKHTGRPR